MKGDGVPLELSPGGDEKKKGKDECVGLVPRAEAGESMAFEGVLAEDDEREKLGKGRALNGQYEGGMLASFCVKS